MDRFGAPLVAACVILSMPGCGGDGSSPSSPSSPSSSFKVLYSFGASSTDGMDPQGLIQGTDGNFYGTTANGGIYTAAYPGEPLNQGAVGAGTLFKITPAGVETVLHSFGGEGDSAFPRAELVQGTNGNFYGITEGDVDGGANIFEISPAGAETVLYSFLYPETFAPTGLLIKGMDGNFYGATTGSDVNSSGTVFQLTPAGVITVLYSFPALLNSQDEGDIGLNALIQGTDGNFYGTTLFGGTTGGGTVFTMNPAGVETVLYSFPTSTTSNPGAGIGAGGLIQGTDGNFYGTTPSGGTNNAGTVSEITPAGVVTVLASFGASSTDGTAPISVIQGTDGNFYGITALGGTNGGGTIFKVTPAGVETVLYSFPAGLNPHDTIGPNGFIQGTDGSFYGTTQSGGANGDGTVFKYTP
jgi:uncharacterized repeat protein (TIGR03803 family)